MRCLIASSKNTACVLLFAYLKQHLLPAIKGMLSDTFTFQQDSAPAHRVPETVKLLSHAMSGLISPDQWPSNSTDVNSADYKSWGVMQ